MKFLKIALFIGYVLLPLFFWPWAPVPFEVPKVWFMYGWIAVLAITFLIESFYNSRFQNQRFFDVTRLIAPVLFVVWILVSSWLAEVDWERVMWGNYYRWDGVVTVVLLITLALLQPMFFSRKWLQRWFLMLLIGAFVTAVGILLQSMSVVFLYQARFDYWEGAYGFTFGQPNFAGGFLSITTPLYYYFWKRIKTISLKVWLLLGLVIHISAVILTFSQAAILMLVITMIMLFHYSNRKKWMVGVYAMLLIFTMLWWRSHEQKLAAEGSADSRTRILYHVMHGIEQRPVVGWGWAHVDAAVASVNPTSTRLLDIYIDKAHSSFLDVLVGSGLIGLALYGVIVFGAWIQLFRVVQKDKNNLDAAMLLIVFSLIIIHAQTNVISITQDIVLWSIIGMTFSYQFAKKMRSTTK